MQNEDPGSPRLRALPFRSKAARPLPIRVLEIGVQKERGHSDCDKHSRNIATPKMWLGTVQGGLHVSVALRLNLRRDDGSPQQLRKP
jgi:hypothetical protein